MSKVPLKILFGQPAENPGAPPSPRHTAASGSVLAEALPLFQRRDETADDGEADGDTEVER